jgi:hypothetical protein
MVFEKNAKSLMVGICLLFLMTLKELRCHQRFFLNGNVEFLPSFLIDLLIVYPTVKKIFNLPKKFPEKTYFL